MTVEDVVVVRSVRGKTLAVMAAHGSKPFMLPLYAEQRGPDIKLLYDTSRTTDRLLCKAGRDP